MTTIAYDTISFAADSQETMTNGERCSKPVRKISLVRAKMRGAAREERLVVATSGSLHTGRALLRHYLFSERTLDCLPPIQLNDGATLLVCHLDRDKDGKLVSRRAAATISVWERPTYCVCRDGGIIAVTGSKFAIGSGCDYARGAMEAGKSATLAVEIAIRLDTGCGPPVTSIDLGVAARDGLTFQPITE